MPDVEVPEVVVPSLGIALGGSTGITPETADFWRLAAEGAFAVPTCSACGTNRWPVSHVCYACGSMAWTWQPVAGTGRVFSFTWIDSPTHPNEALDNIAVIELDGTTGEPVRVPGWVVDVSRDELACDMPVQADFETVADGVAVPHWKPVDPHGVR